MRPNAPKREPRHMTILYADLAWCEHEQWGVQLFGRIAALVRELDFTEVLDAPPPGPHFDYNRSAGLFLGRRGVGPLSVAWDTNLLIDYFNHGQSLWDATSMPDLVDGEHGEDLEALQVIMALWVVRDIRFHIAPSVIHDSKRKPLSDLETAKRRHALDRFTEALTLAPTYSGNAEGVVAPGTLLLPNAELERALLSVPAGNDRQLVRHAIKKGMHVFMTRDRGVLRSRSALRPFGLVPATPGDLLELLAEAGALHCMLAPRYLTWTMPDQHRVANLLHALSFQD